MATQLFKQLLRPSATSIDTTAYICQACKRQESSYRRTRKALRIKPDPSFLPSKTATQDHIIFNPPSSAPNVYHTPLKFLPPTDPRRKLHTLAAKPSPTTPPSSTPASPPEPSSALHSIAASRAQQPSSPLHPIATSHALPPVRPIYEKRYHVTESQIEEIRRLRAEDPRKWTRVRLAEHFSCSQFFVSLCCSSPEMAREQERKLEEVKKRWGRRKTEAREDRLTRKSSWGVDV